jgi:glycosyltransferase involved in cell wall biosynthesis
MKILIVGMPFSIHLVRWIDLMRSAGRDIHFISSMPYEKPHKELKHIVYHDYPDNVFPQVDLDFRTFRNRKLMIQWPFVNKWICKAKRYLKLERTHLGNLKLVVSTIRPDIIHSMESQHAGYLVSDLVSALPQGVWRPFWIHTTFGIDLHYFQHFSSHSTRLRTMFSGVDLYMAEGDRDINFARALGYINKAVKFPSVGGGYDIVQFSNRNKSKPSTRKVILVKGYQDSVRRGLVALRAIVLCKNALRGFEIVAYSCAREVLDYIGYINSKEGLNIQTTGNLSYDDWLNLLASARISITNNLSDGIPSSLFESMLMGVFPIQSNTSIADEWVVDGKTALFVEPEDPLSIASAIIRCIEDETLVDIAAEINFKCVSKTLSIDAVKKKVGNLYFEHPSKIVE